MSGYSWQGGGASPILFYMTQTTNSSTLKPGDVVEFSEPLDAAEVAARYTVVELRGPRVLIRYHCDLPIPPTEAVAVEDVERPE